jgi:hypothetical protein
MANDNSLPDIFELCTPIVELGQDTNPQPNIWSLSQRGTGYTGMKCAEIACLIDKNSSSSGQYKGEMLHPVPTKIQRDPRLAKSIRNVSFYGTKTLDGQVGLLYVKSPWPGGRHNSWIDSAGAVVTASVHQWGHYTADHMAEIYRFEPLQNPPAPPELPTTRELINKYLANYFINSTDDPVIRKLLGYSTPMASAQFGGEDDDSVY